MSTASRQCREFSNRLFTMEDSINKKYPSDYERRKQLRLKKENLFWRLSGCGLLSRNKELE